jgi:hypothetical protein
VVGRASYRVRSLRRGSRLASLRLVARVGRERSLGSSRSSRSRLRAAIRQVSARIMSCIGAFRPAAVQALDTHWTPDPLDSPSLLMSSHGSGWSILGHRW